MKQFFLLALAIALLGAPGSLAQTGPVQSSFASWSKHQPLTRATNAPVLARGATATSLPTRQVSHYWEQQQNRWMNGMLITYAYNAQGLPQQIIFQDSALNTSLTKILQSYNAQGQLTEALSQTWTGAAYTNSDRQQYTYDAQGHETLFLYQGWLNNSWVMVSGTRYTNTYTPAGVLTSEILEGWDSGTNTWRLRSRTTYSVGTNGQWTEVVQQQWNETQYVNQYRARNIVWHDWAKQQPASYEQQDWDSSTSAWAHDQRLTITFQPNGSFVILTQDSPTQAGWTNLARDTYQLDDYGNLLLNQTDEWRNSAWVIRYAYRQLLSYTSANAVRRNVGQSYNRATASYVNSSVDTYSSFITLGTRPLTQLAAATNLYPNPAQIATTFSLTGLREQPALPLVVLNSLGQVVTQLHLQSQHGRIELELPVAAWPAGVYSLRLQAQEGIVTKRLVKQ